MANSILPTCGRKVYLWLSAFDVGDTTLLDVSKPFDASICFVDSEGNINVSFFDHGGEPNNAHGLAIRDPDGSEKHGNPGKSFCTWMPYQVGQAKAAAVQSQVAKAVADAAKEEDLPGQT